MLDFLRKHVLRDLYQPHTWWGFDGPYTRVQLDDGSTFVTIMSSVWRAKSRPHLCHVGYYATPSQQPEDKNEIHPFSCDFFPQDMVPTRKKERDADGVAAFQLNASIPEEQATFSLDVHRNQQLYRHHFTHPETKQKLDIQLAVSDATPHSLLGPMWIGRFLPLPLKWHIFSTRSQCRLTIKEGERTLLQKDGLCHQEKNWGVGFPTAWIWCQGFPSKSEKGSLAIAGGKLTSFLSSFMVAYRSPTSQRNWNFGPVSTMSLFGISPLTSLSKCDSPSGELRLECSNPFLGRKLVISAKAPVDSFKIMSAPLPQGHTTHYCHESFISRYKIECYEKGWFAPWQKVEETELENAALEFGGDWDHWWLERQEKEKQRKQA